jgi:predicted amidohydrolase
MPTPGEKGILISMIIFQPGMPRQTYSKQQLHTDELPFFTPGNYQTLLSIGNCKVAPAICYESLQTTHAENAYQLGAAIYVASVAKSQTGISKALQHYPEIARRFSMPVLMANAVGYCDNFESAGQTAVWDKNGNLTAKLEEKSAGIIVFDTTTATASVNLIAD